MIRLTAITMLAIEIAIHLKLAPDHLREIPYIGVGFVLSSVLLAVAVVALLVDVRWGWALGGALCLGMAALFVTSRVTGLPGFHEAWTSDGKLGLYALVPEAVFLACLFLRRVPMTIQAEPRTT